jgi:hypothetical protein
MNTKTWNKREQSIRKDTSESPNLTIYETELSTISHLNLIQHAVTRLSATGDPATIPFITVC